VKTYVTRHYGHALSIEQDISKPRKKRKERNLWQRQFWEHAIRDEEDFAVHCDYIHINPVHHQFVAEEIYPTDWGNVEVRMPLGKHQYD